MGTPRQISSNLFIYENQWISFWLKGLLVLSCCGQVLRSAFNKEWNTFIKQSVKKREKSSYKDSQNIHVDLSQPQITGIYQARDSVCNVVPLFPLFAKYHYILINTESVTWGGQQNCQTQLAIFVSIWKSPTPTCIISGKLQAVCNRLL